MASPVPPYGCTVWHLVAQRMLADSPGKTQLLNILRQRVLNAQAYRDMC